MNHLATLIPAANLAFASQNVEVPAVVFGFVLILAAIRLYYRHQREKLWHDTARTALEKGQPVPLSSSLGGEARGGTQDLRSGLIILAVGVAFFFADRAGLPAQAKLPAYILTGVGVALLLSALFRLVFSGKGGHADDSNPGS